LSTLRLNSTTFTSTCTVLLRTLMTERSISAALSPPAAERGVACLLVRFHAVERAGQRGDPAPHFERVDRGGDWPFSQTMSVVLPAALPVTIEARGRRVWRLAGERDASHGIVGDGHALDAFVDQQFLLRARVNQRS
jgi:hypothetical protein